MCCAAFSPPIPYTRVNHAKWMVTDNMMFVTTSNWVGDYFTDTAGVSVSIWNNTQMLTRATDIFNRDWNSANAIPLPAKPSTPSRVLPEL